MECTHMLWLARAYQSDSARYQGLVRFAALGREVDLEVKTEYDDATESALRPTEPSSGMSGVQMAINEAKELLEQARSEDNLAERCHKFARAAMKLETAMELSRLRERATAAWCAVRWVAFCTNKCLSRSLLITAG